MLIVVAMIVNGADRPVSHPQRPRARIDRADADGKHLLSDAVTSAAVLVALLLVRLHPGWACADPIAALLVAAYITWMAIGLPAHRRRGADGSSRIRRTNGLSSRSSTRTWARRRKPPQICSYHKLRHRHSGRYHWVDFHIVVPADWSIDHGHQVASTIEYEIEQALGEGNATAHVEPCIAPACPSCPRA